MIAAVVVVAIVFGSGSVALDSGAIGRQVGELLLFALLCGFAAFATIEIAKRVFQLRGIYQERQTERWLAPRGTDLRQLTHAMGLTGSGPGEVRRVFNLPTELLAAQVNAAADLAIADDRYKDLRNALSGSADRPSGDTSSETELLRARQLRAGVDQLQISLGERWRRYIQGAAVWISGAYGIGLILAAPGDNHLERRYILAALIIGGAFAWVIRDLTAIAERSRR
jgi:hypothetical protein